MRSRSARLAGRWTFRPRIERYCRSPEGIDMAFVTAIRRSDRQTLRIQPSNTVCGYAVADLGDGRLVLQLDSYGSETRDVQGAASQTLQFDRDRARELWSILGREFGFR
jgi:hypothetical protein